MATLTDTDRSERLAAWLSREMLRRDLNASKVAERGKLARSQVSYLATGTGPERGPNRPQPLTLWRVARGVSLTRVAATLGHARPSLTLSRYSHPMQDEQAPADVLEGLFGGDLPSRNTSPDG